jgi:aspartate aminotransferase-like enzyme
VGPPHRSAFVQAEIDRLAETQERLFTPGPTPLPDTVREILGRPALHHRTGEFQTVLARVTAGLMRLFDTRQPVLTLTGSGTVGMEALLVNLARPGEPVAVLSAGKFGERWHAIARAHGLKSLELSRPWGTSFTAEDAAAFLDDEAKGVSLLFVTHSETSTGALHDLPGIARVARERGKLVVADIVTSLGVHPVHFDEWGLAGAVAGSQKGIMLPPGLAFVALSEAAWERTREAGLPRFYLDLKRARASLNKNSTPFTPAVPLVLALEESIRLIEKEGIRHIHTRHARHAVACRDAVIALGLELFATVPSNGLTSVRVPEGKDGEEVTRTLREQSGMRIAGGQEPMRGKLFRLGHMGYYKDRDILDLAAALEKALLELGWIDEKCGAQNAAKAALALAPPSPAE